MATSLHKAGINFFTLQDKWFKNTEGRRKCQTCKDKPWHCEAVVWWLHYNSWFLYCIVLSYHSRPLDSKKPEKKKKKQFNAFRDNSSYLKSITKIRVDFFASASLSEWKTWGTEGLSLQRILRLWKCTLTFRSDLKKKSEKFLTF